MAEGTRFKTGYLPPTTSFTALGSNIAADITQTAQAIEDERLQKKRELNLQMGFTKALEETTPAGLNNKFVEGAQMALDKYQRLATKAYASGNPSDTAAYQAARQDYIALKNVTSAKSAINNQTRTNIMSGNIKGLRGTREENLLKYVEQDNAQWRSGEDGSLQVLVNGAYVSWKDSNIADMNDVFMPDITWEGTEFMPDLIGEDIYTKVLKAREQGLQVYDNEGYYTGDLREDELSALVQSDLDDRLNLDPRGTTEAMAVIAYQTHNNSTKGDFSEDDIRKARELYGNIDSYNTLMPDDRNMMAGSFNSSGEYVFEVSDKEVQNGFGGMASHYGRSRKAFKEYYEQSRRVASGLVTRANTLGQKKADEEDRRLESVDAAAEAAAAGSPYTVIGTFPERMSRQVTADDGSVETVYVDGLKVKASIPGRGYKFKTRGPTSGKTQGDVVAEVKNVVFGQDPDNEDFGEIIGFDLSTGPGLLEGLIMDVEGSDIKNVFVKRGTNQFEEILSTMRQTQASSKTKRSGSRFLADAQRSVQAELAETYPQSNLAQAVKLLEQYELEKGTN